MRTIDTPDEYGVDQQFPSEWEATALASKDSSFDVVDMVLAFPEWVHRRKERAEIASDVRVQMHCSLDFTVPKLGRAPTRWLNGRPVVLVPIDILKKKPLISFDCRDSEGHPLPILTRRQNGIIAEAAMRHWATSIAEDAGVELREDTLKTIADIIQSTSSAGRGLVVELLESESPDQCMLAEDSGFVAMLSTLAVNFLLIAVIGSAPGDRRVIKYSYEHQSSQGRPPFFERLGLSPTMLAVPVQMFRDCESYHFEAVAPAGTNFSAVRLIDRAPSAEETYPQLFYEDLRESTPHVAHVSVSRTSLAGDGSNCIDPDSYTDPLVVLATELDRRSWLRSGLLVAILVAAFLTITTPWIVGLNAEDEATEWCLPGGVPVVGPWCMPSTSASGVSGDPAALFVGVVGLLSLVVIRQGEHAYTARLVRPLRNIVWLVSVLPVLGGWLIMFPGPGLLTRVSWVSLVVAAWLGVGVLAAAYRTTPARSASHRAGTIA